MNAPWKKQKLQNYLGNFNSNLKKIEISLSRHEHQRPGVKTQRMRNLNHIFKDYEAIANCIPQRATFGQYGSLFPEKKQKYQARNPYYKSKILSCRESPRHRVKSREVYQTSSIGLTETRSSNHYRQMYVSLGVENSRLRIQNQKLKKKLRAITIKIDQGNNRHSHLNMISQTNEGQNQEFNTSYQDSYEDNQELNFQNNVCQQLQSKIKSQIQVLQAKLKCRTQESAPTVLIDDSSESLWQIILKDNNQNRDFDNIQNNDHPHFKRHKYSSGRETGCPSPRARSYKNQTPLTERNY